MILTLLISLLTIAQLSQNFTKAADLYASGKLEKASKYATQVAVKALEASDTTNLIKSYCLLANIAIDRGDDMTAADYFNKCSDYSQHCEPLFMISSSLYNIASIYYQNGEYGKALEYIEKSITIESIREFDSVMALRYLMAADILFKLEKYDNAIEMAEKGLEFAQTKKNNNVMARLMFVKAKCHEACTMASPNWEQLENEYSAALDLINIEHPGAYFGSRNPYAPEILYRLGLAREAQGKDAKDCFIHAIENAHNSQAMLGTNPIIESDCCRKLAEILTKEGDATGAQGYLDRAESLSYIPDLINMSTKLSLSQMEFIRREKDMEIEKQKEKALYLAITVSIFAIAILWLMLLYRRQLRLKRESEDKNAQLVKLGLQKDKLIEMLQVKQTNQATHTDREELKAIESDSVPLPDIQLTKREKDVLLLCCKGLISKEIADQMNISVRTVESHKYNLFRKIGVNTTNELIAFAFKTGLIK